MSELSEEEIIKEINEWLKYDTNFINLPEYDAKNLYKVVQGLLDLYQKEKEKNNDFVSKDKIRENIKHKIVWCRAEELENNYIGDVHSQYWSMFRELLEKLLQELLEERN